MCRSSQVNKILKLNRGDPDPKNRSTIVRGENQLVVVILLQGVSQNTEIYKGAHIN